MKIKKRAPTLIRVTDGDTVQLTYTETARDERGRVLWERRNVVVEQEITGTHEFDEGIVVESEAGEFGADFGLGGFFLEHLPKAEPGA